MGLLLARPLNEDEVKQKVQVVISCNEQKDVYDHVVAPTVNEALEGYTCTIFAYDQTGNGKTYTMEGEGGMEKNGICHKDAGVIPRAAQQIFGILETQNADYSMKVAYLEIHNEEITDLLAPDEKQKKPIALMEDEIALNETAHELRAELEDATSELIAGSLKWATAMMQHEEMVKVVQENTQSFLSAKAKFVSESFSKGEAILEELEMNLNNFELKIALYLQMEQELCLESARTYRTAESFSELLLKFFKIINSYNLKLTLMEEESQKVYDKKMRALSEKFEVQTILTDFREETAINNSQLKKEMSDRLDINTSIQEDCVTYFETAEEGYIQNSTLIEIWKGSLGESFQHWTAEEQRDTATSSFLGLQRRHIDSCNSIIKCGLQVNCGQISPIASKVVEHRDASEKHILAHAKCKFVDEPSSSSMQRTMKRYNSPSKESSENLRRAKGLGLSNQVDEDVKGKTNGM
ncbi:hypothetical protein M9H77_03278 [Catharanthus roseus]|uniref:Uncharacterized protein n=1 Tax=Catharanthus roseus TaxID=4058 RepID=A0ACC0CAY2_CATRO|nr:hypothetical protein M9H77_03278 [Catharanthus roseus]